jgi:hypothetical protein
VLFSEAGQEKSKGTEHDNGDNKLLERRKLDKEKADRQQREEEYPYHKTKDIMLADKVSNWRRIGIIELDKIRA